jgi:hypothetical protein
MLRFSGTGLNILGRGAWGRASSGREASEVWLECIERGRTEKRVELCKGSFAKVLPDE